MHNSARNSHALVPFFGKANTKNPHFIVMLKVFFSQFFSVAHVSCKFCRFCPRRCCSFVNGSLSQRRLFEGIASQVRFSSYFSILPCQFAPIQDCSATQPNMIQPKKQPWTLLYQGCQMDLHPIRSPLPHLPDACIEIFCQAVGFGGSRRR